MFFGNVLGLMQYNVKRVLAYSSIAHSGYMLVGLAALAGAQTLNARIGGLEGVLFYLAAYGVVNTAAFGVLILLPSRTARLAGRQSPTLADSAESFEDLAGQGRGHLVLGLAMAVACFSLIGIPTTAGFLGKVFLVKPALDARFYWLVVFTMINAAISAAYYLRIVGTLFLRPAPVDESTAGSTDSTEPSGPSLGFRAPLPTMVAIGLSVFATLLLGTVVPATGILLTQVKAGADLSGSPMLAHSPGADAQPQLP
jgi:NADH-quinone oxidoreductase subunit N